MATKPQRLVNSHKFLFNENEKLNMRPKTSFQDRLTSRRSIITDEDVPNVYGAVGDRVVVRPAVVDAEAREAEAREAEAREAEAREAEASEAEAREAEASEARRQMKLASEAARPPYHPPGAVGNLGARHQADDLFNVPGGLSRPNRRSGGGVGQELEVQQVQSTRKLGVGDLRERLRKMKAEHSKEIIDVEVEVDTVVNNFESLRVQIPNGGPGRSTAAVAAGSATQPPVASSNRMLGAGMGRGYLKERIKEIKAKRADTNENTKSSSDNNNMREDVDMRDVNSNCQLESGKGNQLDVARFQQMMLNAEGVEGKEIDPNCICHRSLKLIICKECKTGLCGRIMRRCDVHPEDTYLMDIACCSVVECRSVKLQEYDLPAQAVIDVLKLNDARKRGNNNSQA